MLVNSLRTTPPLAAVAVLLVCGLAATGCDTSDARPGMSAVTPDAARSAAASAPTLAELQEALDLTGEETAALAPLVEDWQDAVAAVGPGSGPHPGRGRMGRAGRPGGGPGLRGHGPCDPAGPPPARGMGRGPGLGADPFRMPPGATFLVDAAEVLDLEKTGSLVTWMAARAEARHAERVSTRGDRPGRGHGAGLTTPGLGLHLRGVLCELDLDRSELRDVGGALRDLADEIGDALAGYADGEVSVDGVRDRAASAVTAFETASADVLDEAEEEALATAIDGARAAHATRALETLDARTARRQTFLTRVLELDDTQVGSVASILAAARGEEETLLTGIADGSVTLPDALHRRLGLVESTRSEISAGLTGAQQAVFESLRGLGPGGFHRRM